MDRKISFVTNNSQQYQDHHRVLRHIKGSNHYTVIPNNPQMLMINLAEGKDGQFKTLSLSKHNFIFNWKGQLIEIPSTGLLWSVEVIRDDFIRVEGSSVSVEQSDVGQSISIVFNALLAGTYTVYLRCNGHVVRGFPSTKRQ